MTQLDYRIRKRVTGKVDPRVERPFDPANLDAGLWLKADDITGLSDGDTVGTWLDSGSYARDMTGGSSIPIYKTNIINSLPVVRFSGSEYMYHNTGWLNSSSSGYAYVLLRTTTAQSSYVISWPNGSTANGFDLAFTPTGFISYLQTGSFTSVGISVGYTIGDPLIVAIRYNSTILDHRISVNLDESHTTNSGAILNGYGENVLGTFSTTYGVFFTGDIGEIIADNKSITQQDHVKVVNYLATKWGVSL